MQRGYAFCGIPDMFTNHQSTKTDHLKIIVLLLCLCTITTIAQERKLLKGKVTAASDDLEGIYVINKTADLSVTTQSGGYFAISARVNDTIIFSAIQFEARDVALTGADMEQELLFVPLQPLVHQLDELVIIDYRHINSVALGLVPAGQRRYTPAERKEFTATNGIDAMFNAFSGRSSSAKKVVETEKKELLMDKINYIYTAEDIVSKFNIPAAYVQGFIYYLVEDKHFAEAIRQKNDAMAKFLMSALSVKYLKLLNNE